MTDPKPLSDTEFREAMEGLIRWLAPGTCSQGPHPPIIPAEELTICPECGGPTRKQPTDPQGAL